MNLAPAPGFSRIDMTEAQEAVWRTTFSTAMVTAIELPTHFFANPPPVSPANLAKHAADLADLIASLLPEDTLPSGNPCRGISRRPC